LITIVVVAEPVGVAIVDEAGFSPCFETIISRMTNITTNPNVICESIIFAVSMLVDSSNFFMRRSILAVVMSIPST
jgi:hypothetical protein